MVEFDPTKGSEIGKTRPALVINVDYLGRFPVEELEKQKIAAAFQMKLESLSFNHKK